MNFVDIAYCEATEMLCVTLDDTLKEIPAGSFSFSQITVQ